MNRSFLGLAFFLFLAGCADGTLFQDVLNYQEWSMQVTTGSGENPENDIVFLIDNSESMKDEIAVLKASLTQLTNRLATETDLNYKLHAVPFSSAEFQLDWNNKGMESSKIFFTRPWATTSATKTGIPGFLTFIGNLQTEGAPPEAGIALAARYLDHINSNSTAKKKNTHFIVLSDEDDQSTVHVWDGTQSGRSLPIHITTENEYRFRIDYDYKGNYSLNASRTCTKIVPYEWEGYSYYCTENGTTESRYVTDNRGEMCDVPEYFICQKKSDNGALQEVRLSYKEYLQAGSGSVWNLGSYVSCAADTSSTLRREVVSKGNPIDNPKCDWRTSQTYIDWNYCFANKVYPVGIDGSSCRPITCEQTWLDNRPVLTGDGITTTITAISQAACPSGMKPKYAEWIINSTKPIKIDPVVAANLPANMYMQSNAYPQKNKYVSYSDFTTKEEALADFLAENPTVTDAKVESLARYGTRDNRENTNMPALKANGEGLKQFVKMVYPLQSVTFNAIVATEDGLCPGSSGSGNGNVRGSLYIEAASRMRGVNGGNICAPNFEEFMANLSKQVVFFNRPHFQLPSWADPKLILLVTDKRTGRILKEGRDYTLDSSRMYLALNPGMVVPDQDLLIELYKP